MQVDTAKDSKDEITLKLNRAFLGWIFVPLAFIVGLALGYFMWGQEDEVLTAQEPTQQPVVIPEDIERYEIPIYADDPVFGAEDAPVTIIEFSDYECPYCRQFNLTVYPQILENYGDQVRYIFKDLPLDTIHPNAIPAAVAALCANEQGHFWEYHNDLFKGIEGLSTQAYLTYAQENGLNISDFTDCLEDNPYEENIFDDQSILVNLGARLSTPTFFVNGIYITGAQPYELFEQVIEYELNLAAGN